MNLRVSSTESQSVVEMLMNTFVWLNAERNSKQKPMNKNNNSKRWNV